MAPASVKLEAGVVNRCTVLIGEQGGQPSIVSVDTSYSGLDGEPAYDLDDLKDTCPAQVLAMASEQDRNDPAKQPALWPWVTLAFHNSGQPDPGRARRGPGR